MAADSAATGERLSVGSCSVSRTNHSIYGPAASLDDPCVVARDVSGPRSEPATSVYHFGTDCYAKARFRNGFSAVNPPRGGRDRRRALAEAVWSPAERTRRRPGRLGNGEHLKELPALLLGEPLRGQHFLNRLHRVNECASSGSNRITDRDGDRLAESRR